MLGQSGDSGDHCSVPLKLPVWDVVWCARSARDGTVGAAGPQADDRTGTGEKMRERQEKNGAMNQDLRSLPALLFLSLSLPLLLSFSPSPCPFRGAQTQLASFLLTERPWVQSMRTCHFSLCMQGALIQGKSIAFPCMRAREQNLASLRFPSQTRRQAP